MKFKCDQFSDWRRERKIRRDAEAALRKLQKETRLAEWHPHFLLWFVRIGHNDCRIFETVERRVYIRVTRGYDWFDCEPYTIHTKVKDYRPKDSA